MDTDFAALHYYIIIVFGHLITDTGLILGLHRATETLLYFVTTFLIGCAQT